MLPKLLSYRLNRRRLKMAIMSKLLRPFRLYSALQQVKLFWETKLEILVTMFVFPLQSGCHGVPTNAAEAQLIMNAMREDALARIGMDVTMKRKVYSLAFSVFISCEGWSSLHTWTGRVTLTGTWCLRVVSRQSCWRGVITSCPARLYTETSPPPANTGGETPSGSSSGMSSHRVGTHIVLVFFSYQPPTNQVKVSEINSLSHFQLLALRATSLLDVVLWAWTGSTGGGGWSRRSWGSLLTSSVSRRSTILASCWRLSRLSAIPATSSRSPTLPVSTCRRAMDRMAAQSSTRMPSSRESCPAPGSSRSGMHPVIRSAENNRNGKL